MVLGAYGKLGRLLIEEAVAAGMTVTAVARREHPELKLATKDVVIKDALALTRKDMAGIDVVVDAVGGWTRQSAHLIPDVLASMMQLLRGKNTRYIKIGGANTLYINAEHSQQLQGLSRYYPSKFKFLCDAHKEALDLLRTYSNVAWTYVTPPVNFDPNGEATGDYHVGGEEFKANLRGDDGRDDYISYADFSHGVIELIQNNQYIRQRITLIHGDVIKDEK